MRVVYHCYGGTHSSVVAASIHVGKLPDDALPSASDLEGLPLFDKATRDDMGIIHRIGSDESGNEIFCLGRRNGALDVIGAIISVSELSGNPSPLFVNTIPCVNNLMRIGGYLSREAGLIRLGRRLVVKGTLKAYWSLVDLVKQVKSQLHTALATGGDITRCYELYKPSERSSVMDMDTNGGLEAVFFNGTVRRNTTMIGRSTTIYVAKAYSFLPVLAETVCRNRFVFPELETLIKRWLESVESGPRFVPIGPDAWAYYVSKQTDVVSKAIRSWCAVTGNGFFRLVDLGTTDQGTMPGLARLLAFWVSTRDKGGRPFAILEKPRSSIFMSFLNAQGRSMTSSIAQVFLTMAVKDTIRKRLAALRDLINEAEDGFGGMT